MTWLLQGLHSDSRSANTQKNLAVCHSQTLGATALQISAASASLGLHRASLQVHRPVLVRRCSAKLAVATLLRCSAAQPVPGKESYAKQEGPCFVCRD
ncbi:hypothetical protein GN958_ATG17094 [Phytophthora infestans]|uniref:Uncharacterized protein n=1 Tax=Phytophthora infestans TaxID=4787 RepID=A0A8S9U2Z2_PHYIN|nr:hypothetical protein GN958_ATG17094 [Phytophthora infestans]